MTNEQIRQEVREAIVKEIADYEPGIITYSRALIMAKNILSLKTENWSIGIVDGTDEPKPPTCVCCEYMNNCIGDIQKVDYCPDPKYQTWLTRKVAGYRKII
jgi:hypothetical protein